MNDRIKELAKQCGYWSGQTIEMNDVGIEKFVELIVRECIDYCGENLSKTVGGALKIYFGVEE